MAPWLKADAIRNDVNPQYDPRPGSHECTPTKNPRYDLQAGSHKCDPYNFVGAPFMAPWFKTGTIRNDVTRDTIRGQGRINATLRFLSYFYDK